MDGHVGDCSVSSDSAYGGGYVSFAGLLQGSPNEEPRESLRKQPPSIPVHPASSWLLHRLPSVSAGIHLMSSS